MSHNKSFQKILLFSILYFISANIILQAQAFYWLKTATVNNISSEDNKIVRTIKDKDNNIWSIGNFSDVLGFSDNSRTASGGTDFFIAKLTENGDITKMIVGSGNGTSLISDIAFDTLGNIFITGLFKGELNLLDTSIVNNSDYKVFLIKINNEENVEHIVQLTSSFNTSNTPHITIDSNNNLVITGPFITTLTGDSVYFNTPGVTNPSIYLIKYSQQLLPLYTTAVLGTSGNRYISTSIASDNNGNVYLTGTQRSGWYTSQPNYFLYKYNNNGDEVWTRYSSSNVSVSNGRKVIVKGDYVALIADFELSGSSAYIKVYTLNGDEYLSTSLVTGWASLPIGLDIEMDENCNIYTICSYNQTFYIGTTPINTIGLYDGIVVKLKNNGEIDWYTNFAGLGNDISSSILLLDSNKVLISGKCTLPASFGSLSSPASLFWAQLDKPKLNITLPQANEVWQVGTTHNISWQAFTNKNINIYLSTDNGTNWITLVTNYNSTLNNYNFTIPPVPNSDKCKIKISTYNSPELSIVTDYNFAITNSWAPYIRLLSFNTDNKVVCANSNFIVTWECDGLDGTADLDITYDNGNNWISLLNDIPVQNKSTEIILPNRVSDKCRLRIKSDMISTVTDINDQVFTICNLELLSPVQNQKVKGEEVFKVKFNARMVNYVSAYYSTDKGLSWSAIQEHVNTSLGEISWNVPGLNCDSVIIKLSNYQDTNAFRIFNTPFTIWIPYNVTKSTVLGNNLLFFEGSDLSLSAFVMVNGDITTRYFKYEAPEFSPLPEGIVRTGTFYWFLNSATVSFINGKLSIPLNSLVNISNPEDLVWLHRETSTDNWTNLQANVVNGNIESSIYFTTLGQFTIGTSDSNNFTSIKTDELPKNYFISNNYPNPFNPITKISFNLPYISLVNCEVYNSIGQKVASLIESEYLTGLQNITWNAINNSSGIYFIVFRIKDLSDNKVITEIRKAVLLK
jgi:hypothetical protein